jgi:hypothetical protein
MLTFRKAYDALRSDRARRCRVPPDPARGREHNVRARQPQLRAPTSLVASSSSRRLLLQPPEHADTALDLGATWRKHDARPHRTVDSPGCRALAPCVL